MPVCLIGMGSNLGDRRRHLQKALGAMQQAARMGDVQVSPWFANSSVGGPVESAPFLNGVVRFWTSDSPYELFRNLRQVEDWLGRTRDQWWGPRTIDLDLLLYGDLVLHDPDLTIPHPWMLLRPFVLWPTIQVAGELCHPHLGWSMRSFWHHWVHSPPSIAVWLTSELDPPSWLIEPMALSHDESPVPIKVWGRSDQRMSTTGSVPRPTVLVILAGRKSPALYRSVLARRVIGGGVPRGGVPRGGVLRKKGGPDESPRRDANPAHDGAAQLHRLAAGVPHLIIDTTDAAKAHQQFLAVVESLLEFRRMGGTPVTCAN